MKRFLLFAVVATLFAACSKDAINEEQGIQNIVDEAPATLTVGFEDDETRIQLNEDVKTVWTNGDLVSVFYHSNANQQWQYTGETGARTADLTRVDAGEATEQINRVVVLYPYNESYLFNTETFNVQTTLPAEQTYLEDSYGLDGNIMVSSSEYNQFKLKTVYGWLKLQLTGAGEKIKSITLRGNNYEQVAGEAYINTTDATMTLAADKLATDEDGEVSGSLIFEDTILKEVTLNCVDGVTLGAEATAFYIALPPQTFTKGLTVEIAAVDGSAMTKTTDNEVVIERNHIKPMTAFGYNGVFKPANTEIYYTNGSTTEPTAPYEPAAFGNATIKSNTYDVEKECWIITFDKDITEIGDWAFYNCSSLTSVTIGDSVTTIGYGAFEGCDSLTNMTIPDSVTTIGDSVFHSCDSLKEFKGKFAADNGRCLIKDNTIIAYAEASGTTYTIPDSVTTIGYAAFSACDSLTSVTIPNSVTTIGSYAFAGCNSLSDIILPDSVVSIGYCAFRDCKHVTKVTIPNNVEKIEGGAFYGCTLLSEFKGKYATNDGRSLIVNDTFIAYAIGCDATEYVIPHNVTKVGQYAFDSCAYLVCITIPESVTEIMHCSFASCEKLTTIWCKPIYPPKGTDSMFLGNVSDRKIYVPTDSVEAYKTAEGWSDYADYIFEEEPKPANNEIWYTATAKVEPYDKTVFGATYVSNEWDSETGKGVITFEGDVTKIGYYAFYECSSLTSVTIPDSVTTIGNDAFSRCYSLTSVTIPDRVTTIGDAAFYCCSSLTSVTIGNSVTTIGYAEFYGCNSLTSVTIGNSVTTIGYVAFGRCTSLTSVTIPDSVTTIVGGAFEDCDSLKYVYCKPTTPPAGDSSMFGRNAAGRRIFVPASDNDSIINAYKEASGWSEYKDYIFEEE